MSLQVARQCLGLESVRKWSEGDVSAGPVRRGWRSCSACCITPHPSPLGTPLAGQLQQLGLVRVKSQFRAHSLQLTSCAGTRWKQGCHGYGRDCLQDQISCSLQTRSSGRVDAAAQGEAGIAAEGLCSLGELQDVQTVLVIPPQHLDTTCCAGPNVQEEFVVSGLGPLSGQRVPVPFQTPPLASK